jgi:HEAT repeat protein
MALGLYPSSDVLPFLQQAVHDDDPFVRLSAAASLLKRHDPQAMELFRIAAIDPDYGIRSAAARALGEIAQSSRPEETGFAQEANRLLTPLLSDPVSRVRSAAARALGMLGKPDALPVLSERLKDDELSVRCYAAGALLRILHEQNKMETDRNASLRPPWPNL